MNYWESGMDMNYGDDLYDSFVAYQRELIEQFDVDGRGVPASSRSTPARSRRRSSDSSAGWSRDYLQTSGYHAPPELAEIQRLSKPAK